MEKQLNELQKIYNSVLIYRVPFQAEERKVYIDENRRVLLGKTMNFETFFVHMTRSLYRFDFKGFYMKDFING